MQANRNRIIIIMNDQYIKTIKNETDLNDLSLANTDYLIKFRSFHEKLVENLQLLSIDFCILKLNIGSHRHYNNLDDIGKDEFNLCIRQVTQATMSDLREINNIYGRCKNECIRIDGDEVRESIEDVSERNSFSAQYPHKCINHCLEIYGTYMNGYSTYMVKSKDVTRQRTVLRVFLS